MHSFDSVSFLILRLIRRKQNLYHSLPPNILSVLCVRCLKPVENFNDVPLNLLIPEMQFPPPSFVPETNKAVEHFLLNNMC